MSPTLRFIAFAVLIVSGISSFAANFDVRKPAPSSVSPDDLRNRVRDYVKAHKEKATESQPAAFIRDPIAYEKWSDVRWRITRALMDNKPVGDLTEFGLRLEEDGSYSVKAREHPEWVPLDSLLTTLLDSQDFNEFAPQLKDRGFRERDLVVMKQYLGSNTPERLAFKENKPLVETFAAHIRSQNQVRKVPDREQVLAYLYQRARNYEEARRRWAVGLLNALDSQRQRILVSFFEEMDVTRVYGTKPVDTDALVKETIEPFITGQYLQAIKQKEEELQQ
ncbi:MAG TPA: hypothetical protein VKB34_01255 [Povalibacter sp.]|nr:hypothetical protein [Povalibacter sp.]